MFQETSRLAYIEAQKNLSASQKRVYDIIKAMPYVNNQGIARLSRLEINKVTPRVKELRDKGVVKEAHRGKDSETGRVTIYWKAV